MGYSQNKKNNSKIYLELPTWRSRFCLASWLAVGFIKVELLGKDALAEELVLPIGLLLDKWLYNPVKQKM